ncbi:MAG TPA: hypothetical protein VFE50_01040 [Cyclobacteriaceae bacterium]|nr:hypothetical protein [Cyclobacteriaceae bacterium]
MKKIFLCFVACWVLGIQTSKAQLEILTYASYLAALPYLFQTTTRGAISPSSHYVFPNSNVTPLGSTTAQIKKFSVLFPPKFKAKDLDELYGQAMSKHQGSDLIIDNKVDTKFTTIFIFQTMTVTLSGTAAHMEVGKQDIGQQDFNSTPPPVTNNQIVVNNTGEVQPQTTGTTEQPGAANQQPQTTSTTNSTATTAQRSTVPTATVVPETVVPEKPKTPSFWFAIHAGLLQPMGNFKHADVKKPLAEAVGAKPGFYAAMEFTEYFKSTYGNPVRFGVTQYIGYSSTSVNFERTYQGDQDLNMIDLKSGLIVTANVGSSLAADFYLRAGALSYEGVSSFGTNFGANLRFKWLISTLSVNTGKIDAAAAYNVSTTSYKIPTTSVKLGLGIKLGKA